LKKERKQKKSNNEGRSTPFIKGFFPQKMKHYLPVVHAAFYI
jgi:hypothetical protein